MSVADNNLLGTFEVNPSGFMTAGLTIVAVSVTSLNSRIVVPMYATNTINSQILVSALGSISINSSIQIYLSASQSLNSTIQLRRSEDSDLISQLTVPDLGTKNLSSRIVIPVYNGVSNLNSQIQIPIYSVTSNLNSQIHIPVHSVSSNLNSQIQVPSYNVVSNLNSTIQIPVYNGSSNLSSQIQVPSYNTRTSDLSGSVLIQVTASTSLESQVYVNNVNQRGVNNMKFLTSLNLSNNELQNALLHKLASAPNSPTAGYVYYNTTDNQVYVYNGSAFVEMTNLSASELLDAIKTVDGASSGLDADLLDGQEGTWYQSRDNHTGTQLASTISDFDTQVRTSRLDQMAIPTASVNLNSQKITNLATPTADTDAANKAYVDAVKQGLDVKDSVRAATTANVDLTTGGTLTVDGVSLTAGDRVLVKNQTTASQNGIYVVAAGAWTRATDADSASKINGGMFTFIEEGSQNGDTGWVLIVDGAVTLGTTELSYVQFSAAGQIIAGDGLTKTGITINAVGTADRISVSADSIDIASTYVGQSSITTLGTITTGTWNGTTIAIANGGTGATDVQGARANLGFTQKYAGAIGNGSSTSITVTHNLNTENVIVMVREASGDKQVVYPDVFVAGVNTATISFSVAPNNNEYHVTVIG